ncbi:unnamed protein product [Prunus armeniaca]
MMSLRRSSKQLAVFGNSTILDHSPYPTGAEDHDYKTWDTKGIVYITWVYQGQEYMELGLQSFSGIWICFVYLND